MRYGYSGRHGEFRLPVFYFDKNINLYLQHREISYIMSKYMRQNIRIFHYLLNTRGIDHMSASSKKKLRKAEKEVALTERQRKERAESKKLKIYSIAFTVLIIAIIAVTLTVLIWQTVDNAGIIPKWTTALTIGEHKLNCVEMNYYYRYAISAYLQNYGGSVDTVYSLFGVNLAASLDQQQYYDENRTWADYFQEQAIDLAVSDYTMYDLAVAEGYTLTAEEQDALADEYLLIEGNAATAGFTDMDEFVRAYYGNGSTYESYKAFINRNALAESYRASKVENFPVTEEKIAEYNKEHYVEFTGFTYNYYTLPYTSFLTGGTENTETGETTYSEEENKAAEEAAKAAAESLKSATTAEELDAAIANLSINKDLEKKPTSTAQNGVLYESVPEEYRAWVSAEDRKAGDAEVFDRVTTSYDEDGNETKTKSGYVVVLFLESNNNEGKLDNVRHILIALQDDELTGSTDTSADAYTIAKEEADAVYEEWESTAKDIAAFEALVEAYSADTTAEGGLYENVSRYDNIFDGGFSSQARDWAVDPARTVGETAIVESDLGYHIMYYVGEGDDNYRHMSIEALLRSRYAEEWYNGQFEAAKATIKVGNWKPIDRSTPPYMATTDEEEA